MEWIKISEDGNDVELVSEEISLVPELALIHSLKYNKGKGDVDGRKRTRAKQELKYLYLCYSSKSPYRDYSKLERMEEAKRDCGFPGDWVESTELQLLVAKYVKGNKSKIERLLTTTEDFLEKFETHLNTIVLGERNASGGMVHDPGKIIATLKQLPGLAQTIQELEQQVKLGVVGNPKSKGDHEMGWMATNTYTEKAEQEDDD